MNKVIIKVFIFKIVKNNNFNGYISNITCMKYHLCTTDSKAKKKKNLGVGTPLSRP